MAKGPETPRRDKLEAFVQAYWSDPRRNATAAARAAGYTGEGAKVTASRLLDDPWVQARLEELRARDLEDHADLRARIRRALERIAFARLGDLLDERTGTIDLARLDDDTRAALAEISVTSGNTSGVKLKALSPLEAMRLLLLMTGGLEGARGSGVTINLNLGDAELDAALERAVADAGAGEPDAGL